MRNRLVWITALLLVLIFARGGLRGEEQVQAATYQFGGALYQLPEGWRKGPVRDQVQRLTTTLKSKQIGTIRIYQGEPRPKDVAAWISAKMIEHAKADEPSEKITAISPPKSSRSGNRTIYTSSHMISRELRAYAGIESDGRVQLVSFFVRIPSTENGKKELQASQASFARFCEGLRVAGDGAQAILRDPVPGTLEGTYMGLETRTGIDLSVRFDPGYYVFSKTGWFSRELPKGKKVADIDFTTWARSQPNRVGHYQIVGNELRLAFADGETKTYVLTRESDAVMRLDKRRYDLLRVPTDNDELVGRFRDFFATGFTPGSGVKGSMVSEATYTFAADGTFQSTRYSGAFANFETASGNLTGGMTTGKTRPEVKGRYELRDSLLWLKISGETETAHSIFILKDNLLYIDGRQYLKAEK